MNKKNIAICPGSTRESGAIFSPCETYRYFLWRRWSIFSPLLDGNLSVIMCNPSTADALTNDPTITRCIRLAQREGLGGLQVVNLYGYRSPNPKDLLTVDDPVGPENDEFIIRQIYPGRRVLLAWGSLGKKHQPRIQRVLEMLADYGWKASCLGINADGSPKHPLYLARDTPIIEYPLEGIC